MLITGKSGTGKSTLLNLLLRFWDPNSGSITIGETDLKHASLKSIRKRIGYCPQTPIFFNTSLISNLVYSNLDKYFEKVEGDYVLKFPADQPPPEVLGLLDEGRMRGAEQREGHRFRRGLRVVGEDLERDGIDGHGDQLRRSR